MTSKETCFFCFVQHGARFWKCLWDYFGLKQVKSSNKVQQGLFSRKKKEETGTTTLECLNYKKSSKQLPSCFIAMRDSPFCKMFLLLFCFEQKKTLKNILKKLYTIKIKEKKRIKEKSSAWGLKKMPKLAQILQQSSGTRQVCVSIFFFSDHCIKQIDSTLPWVCSVIDHRERQNVVNALVTHSPTAHLPLHCFYHILTSSVVYTWKDGQQHGIYLLNA